MRTLETENQRLGLCIRNSEEVVTRERNNMRGAYEKELAEARRLCDELSHEKSRLQLDCGKHLVTIDELQKRVGQLEQELNNHKKLQKHFEGQVRDLTAKINVLDQQKRSSDQDYVRVKSELSDLRDQYQKLEKDLEEETLNRLDNENRVTSLREELAFSKQLYDKELDETRRKRQIEITEMNQELQDEYKQKLQEALVSMREQLDTQIRISRKEIEDMYETKLQALRDMADSNRETASAAQEDMLKLRSQVGFLETQRSKLSSDFADLEKKYNDLLERNSLLTEEMYSRLNSKDMEIKRLRDEAESMMKEYKDLMDTKIMLTMEIDAYRRLLEGEEARLKLSPSPPTGGEVVSARGTKRRRIFQERESEIYATYVTNSGFTGEIYIVDHDLDGMFVKVVNNSTQDVPIGGWTLKRKAGGAEVSYKFHSKLLLKPEMTVTVWSCNSGAAPNPPGDLVMRNQQWPVGQRIRTTLLNVNDEEVAWRESEKSSRSERTSYRSSDPLDYGVEDDEQRCLIM
uniref:LTD domain-containing protein n=1 Tax=Trichuris muris TaxID=70415 RepID=A0A5S6Q993_TRIMR